ncbi:SIR2 family protein [Paraburkholderia sp. MM5384-R2]|uniref:SIR2 family protein n=1 Tax=unclassified Paraburkholderia TaxID=2615204 RepID=UPI0017EA48DD|nr:SIR2 family protein [Paraburkholderia sp. MM5384-R2]MBB5501699.1 hypothetical protein [Paraburkholderia sp. MM5384-R2]
MLHKIRTRLTQAAQFIENFKHRKSLVSVMNEAFAMTPTPSALHCALAQARPQGGWAQLQGLSQAEHFGHWFAAYSADGALLDDVPASGALLYKPIGGHAPASNYLVSDSDFVEVMTEIDIQTPIPPAVQAWRSGRSFLFLGFERRDDRGRIAGGRSGHRRRGSTRPRAGARTACAGRFRRGHRRARARGRPC